MTRIDVTSQGRSFGKTSSTMVKSTIGKPCTKLLLNNMPKKSEPQPERLSTIKRDMLELPKNAFFVLVEEILQSTAPGFKFQKTSLDLLQDASEAHIDDIFKNTMECCRLDKREEPTIKDFKLATRLITPRTSKSHAVLWCHGKT